MLKDSVTIDDAIALLNDAYEKDPEAIDTLAKTRVVCNKALADHPTIQVGKMDGEYKAGIIGIINGIFGAAEDGFGAIAGIFDDAGKLTGFKRIR